MSRSTIHAKRIIKRQLKRGKIFDNRFPFTTYSKFYLKSNENIAAYLKTVDFNNVNNALTVLSSGDHAFNLLLQGIDNIDTFDKNKLTSYYSLGLKKAMILKFSYEEYVEILPKFLSPQTTLEEITEIIFSLLPYMEEKYCYFWKEIAEYNYKMQKNKDNPLNLMTMMSIDEEPIEKGDLISGNTYLLSEDNYNLLKSKLVNANITFKKVDAMNLTEHFTKHYDAILLSNVIDYFCNIWGENWDYSLLEEYETDLKSIVNEDGIIFLNYLFSNKKSPSLIKGTSITKEQLTDEEIIKIPSITTSKSDIVILARK